MSHRRQEALALWMDHVNARAHCVDVFDRFPAVTATLLIDDAPSRGVLQVLSTHLLIVDDRMEIIQSVDLNHVHTIKRYQEILFPNRTFAETPKFRTSLEMGVSGLSTHRLVMEGEIGVRVGQLIEYLWRFHYGKLPPRLEAMCRGYHLSDALYALSLLPLDVDCVLYQQLQGSTVANVEKPLVLRIDENMSMVLIFRPESLAETAHTRAIELPLDQVSLITAKDDELRMVTEDGRVFLIHQIRDAQRSVEQLMSLFFANAATMVYRKLQFQYPFYTFRQSEVARLYDHYLNIDLNLDGHISQEEFNASLGPILVQVRAIPKALYALCDCFGVGKIRLFEYLHGFRVLLKGNYQDRVRYLFLLFDSKRQGAISYLQFLDGLKTLSSSVDLAIPSGESLETLTFRLFNEIDVNRDNSIQFEEFERALKSNFGLLEVLKSAGANSLASAGSREGALAAAATGPSAANPARVLSFGHPQWTQICQILTGIEMSVVNAAAFRDAPESSAAQNAKFTYTIPNTTPTSMGSSEGGGGAGSSSVSGGGGGGGIRNPFGKSSSVSFADYCPAVFEAIRRRFGVSKEAYLESLGFSQTKRNLFLGCLRALYEMSSSGRSGSFFYSSMDNRFILKTIPQAEATTLRRMLPQYYQHLVQYPNTLLTRFCGLHALTRNGVKMIFVVMQNIFLNAVPIQETFDLKGSTINRSTPMEMRHLGVALKDNDFGDRKLIIPAAQREMLIAQLEADSKLLTKIHLNDYSFLLGIHRTIDGPLPTDDPLQSPSPKYSAFQKEYGGVCSVSREEVYFVGIIDCLTDYGLKKMGEHLAKSVISDPKQVSCVPPAEYQKRFVEYLASVFVSPSNITAGTASQQQQHVLT